MYNTQADLNLDDFINGFDHIQASLTSITDIYDVEEFQYDLNGNRRSLLQNGDEYRYEYGDRNRLIKIRIKRQGTSSLELLADFEYDANGNLTRRTVYLESGQILTTDYEYDVQNRLTATTVDDIRASYYYDNAGNRFLKRKERLHGTEPPEPLSMTLYIRHGSLAVAMDAEIGLAQDTFDLKSSRYVLSGDLIAGRVTTTQISSDSGSNITESRDWYHLDHLNSTKLVTDEAGEAGAKYTYRAFGEELAKLGDIDATYTYSGKERDEETNLHYFNARYYDSTLGRFINVDPVQDGNNWYVYARNNPLSISDPTGLVSTTGEWIEEKGIKAAENGNTLATAGWAFAKAAWDFLGPEAVSKVTANVISDRDDLTASDVAWATVEVVGVAGAGIARLAKGARTAAKATRVAANAPKAQPGNMPQLFRPMAREHVWRGEVRKNLIDAYKDATKPTMKSSPTFDLGGPRSKNLTDVVGILRDYSVKQGNAVYKAMKETGRTTTYGGWK